MTFQLSLTGRLFCCYLAREKNYWSFLNQKIVSQILKFTATQINSFIFCPFIAQISAFFSLFVLLVILFLLFLTYILLNVFLRFAVRRNLQMSLFVTFWKKCEFTQHQNELDNCYLVNWKLFLVDILAVIPTYYLNIDTFLITSTF